MNDPLGCVATSTLSCIASTSWLVPRSKRQVIWFFSVVDGCPEVDDVRRVVVRIVGPLCTLHGEDRIWREQKLFLRARTLAHACTRNWSVSEEESRAVQRSYREVAALDVVHMLAPVLEVCSSSRIDVYNPFDARRVIGVCHVNEALGDRLPEGCRQKSRDAILLTGSKERLVLIRQGAASVCNAMVGKLESGVRPRTANNAKLVDREDEDHRVHEHTCATVPISH
jgi:hypothetical protein